MRAKERLRILLINMTRTYVRRSYNCRCKCGQRLVFKDYKDGGYKFDIELKKGKGFKTLGSVELTVKQMERILDGVLK